MSSAFDDQFLASGRPQLLAFLGRDVVVTAPPPDGTAKTIKGIVSPIKARQINEERGVAMIYEGVVEISLDATDGIAAPTNQHKVTIDSVVYNIVDIEKQSGMAALSLFRRDMQELSHDLRGTY